MRTTIVTFFLQKVMHLEGHLSARSPKYEKVKGQGQDLLLDERHIVYVT